MAKRQGFFWTTLFMILAVTGCGDGRPKRILVSGIVVIDGKPLHRGAVKFVPTGARASRAQIGEDGRFVMNCYEGGDGIVPGTHSVSVASNKPLGDTGMKWFAPKKYSDHRTSGLEFTLTEDTPDLKIELTWDGGKPYTTGRASRNASETFLEE